MPKMIAIKKKSKTTNNYRIKDVFLTLQGEGVRAGTRAVFVRFVGCNMWNGDPKDRKKGSGACAMWCDTDFSSDGSMSRTAQELADMCIDKWGSGSQERGGYPSVVLTGGEPMLQVDDNLLDTLFDRFFVAVETNGSVRIEHYTRCHINHLCISPKFPKGGDCKEAINRLKVRTAEELKIVYPGVVGAKIGWTDAALHRLEEIGTWDHMVIQPQDPIDPKTVEISYLRGDGTEKLNPSDQDTFLRNLDWCVDWVMKNPGWRLGTQLHKTLRLP